MNNTSINFTSFTQTILKILREKLGSDYTVFSHQVKKNNGMELTGIVAKCAGRNTSPTIYIDSFYKSNITEEEIRNTADILYHEFQAVKFEEDLDLSGFVLFDKARDRLCFKLIHAKKNKALLESVPYKRFHDLAIVFYYTVHEAPFYGKATILVQNSHVERWGTNADELLELAFKNTPVLYPAVITSMADVMKEILAEGLKADLGSSRLEEEKELFEDSWIDELIRQMSMDIGKDKIPMYVLTNKSKVYGAACMLYPDVLKNFCRNMGQDFYILPSSVHEVIMVPADAGTNKEGLREIVTDINRTQVAEEEVLADSVYLYRRDIDKIMRLS